LDPDNEILEIMSFCQETAASCKRTLAVALPLKSLVCKTCCKLLNLAIVAVSDGINCTEHSDDCDAEGVFSLHWFHMLLGYHDDVLCSVFCIMEQDGAT